MHMTQHTSPCHILIDFENVPGIDLTPIAGLPVEVTVLVGQKNKRLDVDLVAQMLAAGSRVHLIKLGVSGRNALDFTLAYYLGRAAAENPRGEFFIISKDKGYDGMITHLNRNGVKSSRCASIGDLPFLPKVPKSVEKHQPDPSAAPVQSSDRYGQFLEHLQTHPNNQPKRRTTLLRHIKTHFGNKPTDAEAEKIIEKLRRSGHIAISDKGGVNYRQ